MQVQTTQITTLVIISTVIFLLMPIFLVFYIKISIKYRKNHILEKTAMTQEFESELLKTQLEVQEQTMQSIASELHDNVGQLLSLTTLTLNSIDLSNTDKAGKKIENSLAFVNNSIKELRELARLLHGEQIVQNGIGNAIDQELSWLSKAGVHELIVNNQLLQVNKTSPDKDLIILRLLQEIINNIIKHAKASIIEVECYFKNDVLFLNVKENGVGFNVDESRKRRTGMGLNSIYKRIEMINGKLDLNSLPNQGTIILIEIPYP